MIMTFNLITYGITEFRMELFEQVKNKSFGNKPKGGFWACPVDAEFGWKEFCESEDWNTECLDKHITFTFTGDTLVINSLKDLAAVPMVRDITGQLRPDFEKIAEKYDAIYLTHRGQAETRYSQGIDLHGWDIECVLILNPNIKQYRQGGM